MERCGAPSKLKLRAGRPRLGSTVPGGRTIPDSPLVKVWRVVLTDPPWVLECLITCFLSFVRDASIVIVYISEEQKDTSTATKPHFNINDRSCWPFEEIIS